MRIRLLIIGLAGVALASGPTALARGAEPASSDLPGGSGSQLKQIPGRGCGATLAVGKAVRIARGTAGYRRAQARYPRMQLGGATYSCENNEYSLIFFSAPGTEKRVLDVEVDFQNGRVLNVWEGHHARWLMTRGYEQYFGRNINRWFVWLPLCLLFVAPFVNFRRPQRLLHLDLLVLVAGFGLSQIFFNRGEIDLSTPLVYPVLAYFLVRALVAGFRPRKHDGPLVPHVPHAVLLAGLLLLVAFRIGFNVIDSEPIDVSYAGVAGADRIVHGKPLYTDSGADDSHFDTYGPALYLAYVPVEAAFPLRPDDPLAGGPNIVGQPAAHAAAILFDLLTILGLFLLGMAARAGAEGRRLGVALAYAWAALPYSAYALANNTNDVLISALLVFALLAIASPVGRAVLLALAGMAKFGPLALAPLLATARGNGDRRLRPVLIFSAAFVGTCAALLLPFVRGGADGLVTIYDQTVGYQVGRVSPLTIWGLGQTPDFLHILTKIGAIALGIAVAFFPRKRSTAQVAALAAAVLIAVQIAGDHWFYLYIVWFAPLLLFALFSEYATKRGATSDRGASGSMSYPRRRGGHRSPAASMRSPSG